MSEWREKIVRRLVPNTARVTAVSDADGLLRDPGVFQSVEAKGFAVVQFEDSISFRFDYESRFRSKWDAGEKSELVVVFKPGEYEFDTLPADVLANAQRLSFTLKEIFPKLSFDVVFQLETVYYDALYRAQQQYATCSQDQVQTLGFVLRHVFQIEPAVIKSLPDLLKMLCERHYRKLSIPAMLDKYLVAALRQNPDFKDWPLEIIVPNPAAFWEFLNERWPIYVRVSKGATEQIQEQHYSLKYPGPALLPFGHDTVRVHIDNLFEDGLLTPVEWDWSQALDQKWIRVGLLGNKVENTDLRFEELGKNLLKDCPDKNAAPQSWLAFAYRYAQARMLWTQISAAKRAGLQKQFPDLCGYANQQFYAWLTANYGGIFNYPASSPLMVHHIPGFISHQFTSQLCHRAAFILVDGLAIDQWLILKDVLKSQGFNAPIEENALFAWLPTITPISRQAAFAGKIPRYFADTLHRTDRDEAGWRQFWADHSLSPAQIAFAAVPGNAADLAVIDDVITPQTRALGVTLFKVDKIMHGMQLGAVGMAGQVRTWAEEGFLAGLLKQLRTLGFDVFISADHGNTDAVGIGNPKEGVLSDKGGERCRIYSDPVLNKTCLAEFPEALVWDHPGLPDNLSTLLAPSSKAFSQKGATLLCHGGPSLEEVCVPFLRIPATTLPAHHAPRN
jgi:hypothetical protein